MQTLFSNYVYVHRKLKTLWRYYNLPNTQVSCFVINETNRNYPSLKITWNHNRIHDNCTYHYQQEINDNKYEISCPFWKKKYRYCVPIKSSLSFDPRLINLACIPKVYFFEGIMKDVQVLLIPGFPWRKQHSTEKKVFSTCTYVLNIRKKLVECYVWRIALFVAENWTPRKVYYKYLESFNVVLKKKQE